MGPKPIVGLVMAVAVGIAIGLALATLTDVEAIWSPASGELDAPTASSDREGPSPDYSEYEDKLQRPLFELATGSEAPPSSTSDLTVARMVRVVIQLASEDAELPSGYAILEEARGLEGVQAWVPVADLLALAEEDAVAYIRPPQQPQLH